MIFLLTEQEAREAIAAIANGIKRKDGLVQVELSLGQPSPDRGRHSSSLAFLQESRTVRVDNRSVRLSPTQFSLLRHLHEHKGQATFEDAQDSVWGKEASDAVIRQTCSNLSTVLLDGNIPYAVVTRRGRIYLESAGV